MKDKGERRETSVNERGQIEYIRNERVKKMDFFRTGSFRRGVGREFRFFFNEVLKREKE